MTKLTEQDILNGFITLKIEEETQRRKLSELDITMKSKMNASYEPLTTTNTFGFEIGGSIYAELEPDSRPS